jgi:hypothetical protein
MNYWQDSGFQKMTMAKLVIADDWNPKMHEPHRVRLEIVYFLQKRSEDQAGGI